MESADVSARRPSTEARPLGERAADVGAPLGRPPSTDENAAPPNGLEQGPDPSSPISTAPLTAPAIDPPAATVAPPSTETSPSAPDATPEAGSEPTASTPEQRRELWDRLQVEVRNRVQPEQFETWFRRTALVECDDEHIAVAAQNKFTRDWLHSYYREVIERAVAELLSPSVRVDLVVDPELTAVANRRPEESLASEQAAESSDAPGHDLPPAWHKTPARGSHGAAGKPAGENGNGKGHGAGTRVPRSLEELARTGLVAGSDIGLNAKYTFDNFVVGPCNRFAHATAVGVAEQPGRAYNPLFLHGSVGLGKTHLLQSVCFSMLGSWPDVQILFLTCETFVNHFISALENGDLQKFRNKYRNVDVLVVDDIHLLANKERTQEEFFHTFNTLYNAGKQIVLSSDSPPKDIPTLQERLVSRFKWGLVTELETPCYETRMAILKRKSRERGHELPDDVARLLAERIDTNIRELEGAVTKLLGYANLSGQPLRVELVREAMSELFTQRRGQPSMDDIIKTVTDHFGVKLSDLQSRKRTNAIAYPRQIAMFLARRITRHSLEEIGGFFGGRDHSTVLYGVDKIERLMREDEACRDVVHAFLDDLQATR